MLQDDLPFEKNVPRFYNFYFQGLKEPLKISANYKSDALLLLEIETSKRTSAYYGKEIINETVCLPIIGVSKIKMDGKEYVWCGLEFSDDGWIEFDKFNETFLNQNSNFENHEQRT